ncbi:MAG: prepilin-type N-terminal cleavage/methylation domain-containing protein [Candidatus Taylorbacteria bacterium]|nr:prepilin-type N-terminal cleavage/methylation domain-containing protein [Candidatus Taylorbacteria bacterium]
MSHLFTKKGLRGFTLIELLVVIAIIGLLSTVIAAPIQNARKKAKDVKKIAELKALSSALDQYAEAFGEYPLNLAALTPQYMTVLPVYAIATSPVRDKFAYVVYTGTAEGSQARRFAYHLGVHLDVYSDTLKSDGDCSGMDAAPGQTALTAGKCTFFNGNGTISYPNWVTGMIGTSDVLDFVGTELQSDGTTPDTICAAVKDCVFDITATF